ncbi:16S rRNA (uracil(1498)-N(3))-methyltransferase [Lederbergia citrea]|uniref:Ribosomal RNA small subunit methyltransferase E n=1 Tax=Lederbergia citrea TaxID=2833581 RepID=A0A942UMG4_9BACI|nr:16S rRNA (uracil(1498)-N(3))-methyltransferase [Lederbergia citrea]MBS4176285.1 16S rRNA (uracil(1498)-N(3))-methyltransferase [Lederbergia citrea]MBS4202846.1 16S rRNA (uracil(1498)-N(3))-methyltransferase [Lederbergia citrea]MBS4222487.1 16S rRNA (uracil(1498)-N(3))-methyltransferase [Lederbergia citrea]
MQRYFIEEVYSDQKSVRISGDDFHHIARVMRMNEGDLIWVVYKDAKTASAKITHISDSYVEAEITDLEKQDKELPVHIAIASGLPKGDKLEWIIQKGTELGASEFVPFIAGRSIVKWDDKKAPKKLERWNKIAKEAAEQSHRQVLPPVHSPISFNELIDLSRKFDRKIVAYEEEAKSGEQKNFVKELNFAKQEDKILLVFGPEGGLTSKEASELSAQGFELCGLGPRILRTETAPLYALSAISYHFELMR